MLQVLEAHQLVVLRSLTARLGPPAQELERYSNSLIDTAQVICPGEDPQLLARELIRQQFTMYSEAKHAALTAFLAANQHPR